MRKINHLIFCRVKLSYNHSIYYAAVISDESGKVLVYDSLHNLNVIAIEILMINSNANYEKDTVYISKLRTLKPKYLPK